MRSKSDKSGADGAYGGGSVDRTVLGLDDLFFASSSS